MDPFSRRTRFEFAQNSLTQALAQAHAEKRGLLDLTVSNVTEVGLALDHETLRALLVGEGIARYSPEPFGSHAARAALSARAAERGMHIPVAQILLTASTSEAYGYLFKLLCDPGDVVLVPAPSYPLLDVLATLEGVRIVPYPLHYDGEWYIDRSIIALSQERRARAIVTVHPNNPTGSFLKRAELAILAECRVPILSDEVFVDYAFEVDPERAVSVLEIEDSLVFCMGGLSKALGLPQLKLAWTMFKGPAALVDEARMRLEHVADSYLSTNTPVQLALPALLSQEQSVQERIRQRCVHNLAQLRARCANTEVSCLRVEGGWYAIVRLPHLLDDEAWCLRLLETENTVVQPGYFYGLSLGVHVVLSLITPEETFARGVSHLVACVRAVCESEAAS